MKNMKLGEKKWDLSDFDQHIILFSDGVSSRIFMGSFNEFERSELPVLQRNKITTDIKILAIRNQRIVSLLRGEISNEEPK